MATNEHGDLSSKSDDELLAMERDPSLSTDTWTAVEAERGRREQKQRRPPIEKQSTGATMPEPTVADSTDQNVTRALAELQGILVPGERLLAFAVQRRLFALVHRRTIVGATTGRFVALYRGLIGGYTPFDVRWQDLQDARIRAGIFGADLIISSLVSGDLATRESAGGTMAFRGLAKEPAQRVYRICQQQEQSWREKRRVRDLAEMRAESGGVQIGGGLGSGAGAGDIASASASVDPAERLRRAKDMLDNGLITDAEYEAIKARVVDAL